MVNSLKDSNLQKNRRIQSIEDYITLIVKDYSSFKPNAFYERKRVFYRGQSRSDYKLIPSLARKIKSNKEETFTRFEGEMIKTARLQNPEEFNCDIYPVNMLARMQHYGLPTRLLDITENALVALYFACKGDYKHNGAVYCFVKEQQEIHSAYSIYANIIASFYDFSTRTTVTLNQFWEAIKYERYIPRKERDKDFNDVRRFIEEELTEPIFFLPEMLTEREKRQQAAFMIFPNDWNNIHDFSNRIIEYSNLKKNHIIIEATAKRKILGQLAMLGISEQFLFPEIDKKCSAIKEQTKNLIDENLHQDYQDFRG